MHPTIAVETAFEALIDGIVDRHFAVLDGFLSELEVVSLRSSFEQKLEDGAFHRAGIGQGEQHTRDAEFRGDLIHWLDRSTALPTGQAFLDRMDGFVSYLNRTCYTGLNGYEFHYAVYPTGTFYKRHLDQFHQDDHRRYSVICYLNDNWQPEDGGELVIYHPDGDVVIEPLGGRVVFFESALLEHEVLPARRDRYSLTGWLRR
ncbi:MAG: 2OG-Fe(II) oxygenase [Lewinella sp.]|nr:2OG-Fe(II) oxygenase [Lewinella sp.]